MDDDSVLSSHYYTGENNNFIKNKNTIEVKKKSNANSNTFFSD